MSKKVKVKKTVEELLEEVIVPEEEQPYEVPENWIWTKLGTVIEINPQKTKLDNIDDEQVCSFVPMASVSEKTGRIEIIEERAYEKVKKGYTQFFDNDILFAKITPCMENGKVAIAENLLNKFGYGSTEFYVLRTNQHIDTKFIYHLVRSEYFRNRAKGNMTGAVGQQRVPKKYLESYPISLPPLNEQKRIADKVERLLNTIDEARHLIEEARETFELRRAAIINKSIKGQLGTNNPSDMSMESVIGTNKILDIKKQEYKIPTNWIWVKVDSIISFVGGGTPSKQNSSYWNGDIHWASVKDIKGPYLNNTQDKITQEGLDNSSASLAKKGELLLITRMSPGKCIITNIDTAINQDLKIVRPKVEVNPLYIWLFFSANTPYIESISTGTTVKGIQVSKLKELSFPLPPINEQDRIVNKAKKLLRYLEEEITLIPKIEQTLHITKQSILSKAFRGELGTNDPTEESVIQLLKEVLQKQFK